MPPHDTSISGQSEACEAASQAAPPEFSSIHGFGGVASGQSAIYSSAGFRWLFAEYSRHQDICDCRLFGRRKKRVGSMALDGDGQMIFRIEMMAQI